ncbi:MAG: SDR family oxidoreductase [Acidimicrobiales bacterium]
MENLIAFVTGATGLLGNNLVRELLAKGYEVRALVRSKAKAQKQFAGLDIQIVEGDMLDVPSFAASLRDATVVFHTAAYFRDNYKGGTHWKELYDTNVLGTRALLGAALEAGVHRFVHASSVAVLNGKPGQTVDETMLRQESDADDYYRSKILSDREVLAFLEAHSQMWAVMVLPGWMHGPGDAGPTSAGQTVLDFANRRFPGIPPGSFSVVDARDVAKAMILANERGIRAGRYLAAGRHMTMAELFPMLANVTGVESPTRRLPLFLLYVLGTLGELQARLTRKPVLISWATVSIMAKETEKSRFSNAKSRAQLGLEFRSIEETLRDEVGWYRSNGYLVS